MKYEVSRHLVGRFLVAALFLAVAAVGSFLVADYHTRTASRDAEITNIAGRQRMLAESIAHLHNLPMAAATRQEIAAKVRRMRDGLATLLDADSSYLDAAEVRQLCLGGESALRPRILRFLEAAERGDRQTVTALHPALVADIDRAVTAYAAYAARRITVLRGIEAAGLTLQLTVLWLVWQFIFRPLAYRLDQDVRALNASRIRNRAILDAAGEGICGIDPQGCIIFINDAGCRLLGHDREVALGANLHTLAHHHDAAGSPVPPEACPLLQAVQQQKQCRLELDAFWRSDGSRFPVEVVCAPLHGHGGFIGSVIVFSDISARKNAEACHELSSNVFNNIAEGVFITLPDGQITLTNPAFSVITGYQPEEAVGQTPRLLKSGRHDPTFYQAMWEQIGSQGFWRGEIWNRRKDGELFCCHQTVTAIRDGRGNVTHYVSLFRDVTEHKASEEMIRLQAYHDPLTGLPNRNLFMDRLKLAMAQSRRNGRALAIMFVDLDRFKEINDGHGHAAGDSVLCETSRRLRESLRDSDTVARFGGDEFVVLLTEIAEPDDAAKVAGKMLQHLSRPFGLPEHTVEIGASIGIALFPRNGDDTETLMRAADTAMYAVKSHGRNGFRFA